jgi:hypothetical protein
MAYPFQPPTENAWQIAGNALMQGGEVLGSMRDMIEKRKMALIAQRQAELEAQQKAEALEMQKELQKQQIALSKTEQAKKDQENKAFQSYLKLHEEGKLEPTGQQVPTGRRIPVGGTMQVGQSMEPNLLKPNQSLQMEPEVPNDATMPEMAPEMKRRGLTEEEAYLAGINTGHINPSIRKGLNYDQELGLIDARNKGAMSRVLVQSEMKKRDQALKERDLEIKSGALGIRKDQAKRKFAEQDANLQASVQTLGNTTRKFERIKDDVKYIYDNEDLWGNAGLGKGLASMPGSTGADIKAKLEYAVNSLLPIAIKEMKDAGATFGAMSNQEWDTIKSTIANLDPNQSPESYYDSVGEILLKLDDALAVTAQEAVRKKQIITDIKGLTIGKQKLLDWARENPNNPKSKSIIDQLGGKQ